MNEWVGGIRVVGQHEKEFDALILSLTHVGKIPASQRAITKAATAPKCVLHLYRPPPCELAVEKSSKERAQYLILFYVVIL